MALMRGREVPTDAVVVSEIEATTYAWDMVTKWEDGWDTWALRYSPGILGSISAMSGMAINRFYRKKLKLGSYGYFATIIPLTVMPGILTALFHRHAVSTGMLLMKNDGCPICYEVRSAAIQLGCGIVYPAILGPLSTIMLANRYNTYRVPDLLDGPKPMFQFLRKISRPFGSTLIFMGTFQCIMSSILTYFEMKNNITLRRKLVQIENQLEREENPKKVQVSPTDM